MLNYTQNKRIYYILSKLKFKFEKRLNESKEIIRINEIASRFLKKIETRNSMLDELLSADDDENDKTSEEKEKLMRIAKFVSSTNRQYDVDESTLFQHYESSDEELEKEITDEFIKLLQAINVYKPNNANTDQKEDLQ